MTASAPRYDRRLLQAIVALDDERVPIAETCRRVGEAAERMGAPRPSYVHVRRLVQADRERRRELRAIRDDFFADLAHHRVVDVADLAMRRRDANLR